MVVENCWRGNNCCCSVNNCVKWKPIFNSNLDHAVFYEVVGVYDDNDDDVAAVTATDEIVDYNVGENEGSQKICDVIYHNS